MKNYSHIPVLLTECLDHLKLSNGTQVIDCTLGLGGHSLEILKKIGKKGKLMVFEQDGVNLKEAKKRLAKYEKQIIFVHDNFENIKKHVKKHKFKPEAILFDLGLSSPHIDNPERGFAIKDDGPLDMRFDKRISITAEKVVNKTSEKELANIIFHYGEEKRSRIIARKIVERRKEKPIKTTHELAEIIKNTIKGPARIHPAKLTFQALRIYVNRELEVLESALDEAIKLLVPGGHIVVISYHSLEDRIVKRKFRYYAQDCICPKELHICQCNFKKRLYILTKRPIIPLGIEVESNPRARSAKLRVAKAI